MPFKDFAAGDVLTAADVDDFLMRQTVMTFDDSTARGTALGTAVITEGMVTFLKDTDALEFWDGSSWQGVSNPGDITAVTAGTALTGGGSTGDVTLNVDLTAIAINNTQITNTLTTEAGTAYTVVTADANKFIRLTNDNAVLTISTSTDFTAGQQVQIFGDGTATSITTDGATIAGAGTSTTSGTFVTGNQYEAVSIFCVDTDTYRIIGNVSIP